MKYKVILWDFDGTLANTGADVWDSLEYAAGKLGGSMDEKFKSCDSNLGKPMREIFRQVHPFPGEEKLATFDEWVTIHIVLSVNIRRQNYIRESVRSWKKHGSAESGITLSH